MSPLILPIQTPLGQYFYETQRNEIVKVNLDLFNYINALIENNQLMVSAATNETISEYQDLIDCGYLANSHINTIEHPKSKVIDKLLERKIDKITLQLTQQCNLRCTYCIYSESSSYNRSHSNNVMSLETAKKAIDFYYEHSIDSERALISFYGGEPLLKIDLIKTITDYANKKFEGRKITYSMTTNATLFSDEVIDFIFNSGNDFSILISLDGPKSIQDKNRKFPNGRGSFEIVMRNIRKIIQKNPEDIKKIHVNSVVDPQNDYDEIVKIFNDPILKNIEFQFNFVEHDGKVADLGEKYKIKYNYDIFLGYLTFFREEKKVYPNKMMEFTFNNYRNDIEKMRTNNIGVSSAPSGPCEAGLRRLFISYDGNFFPCERVSEISECMNIGSLEKGLDIEKIRGMMNIAQLTEEQCKNCWAFSLCTICVKKADNQGHLSAAIKQQACEGSKSTAFNKIMNKILMYENSLHEKKMHSMKEAVVK